MRLLDQLLCRGIWICEHCLELSWKLRMTFRKRIVGMYTGWKRQLCWSHVCLNKSSISLPVVSETTARVGKWSIYGHVMASLRFQIHLNILSQWTSFRDWTLPSLCLVVLQVPPLSRCCSADFFVGTVVFSLTFLLSSVQPCNLPFWDLCSRPAWGNSILENG